MKVELVGPLIQLAGVRVIEVELGGPVALEDALSKLPPNLRRHILSEEGSINPGLIVLVNGADVRSLTGGDFLVSDEDTLTVIPAIHGGLP